VNPPDLDPWVPLGDGSGTVIEFDEHRGLGRVRRHDGVDYPFHCVSIADGTRTIAVGAHVSWRVVPGRMGRWEATEITAVGQ